MNGAQDMGGMQSFGPVQPEPVLKSVLDDLDEDQDQRGRRRRR